MGSPEGSPPRRQGETREHGDVGEAAMRVQRSPAAAALGGGPLVGRDEGSNLTCEFFLPVVFKQRKLG